MKTTLEVGDKIKRTNIFGIMVLEIERVTKTKAVTKSYNNGGAIMEFHRNFPIRRKDNKEKYSMNDYELSTDEK
jgi:hypothetical protein